MPVAEKNFHIATEAASVFILVPLFIWIALNQTNKTYMVILLIIAISCIIVDGYLLLKYREWSTDPDMARSGYVRTSN